LRDSVIRCFRGGGDHEEDRDIIALWPGERNYARFCELRILVVGFDFLRIDGVTGRCDDCLLYPPADEEETLGVETTPVSGAQPTFLERFRCCLGIVEITLHDSGAPDQDLTVLVNTDLNAWERSPD